MIPLIPRKAANVDAYRPLLDLLDSIMLTPAELGAHWRYSDDHLCNLRRAGKGPPWVRLPTGAIRYRASDIMAAEIAGTCGGLTLDQVCLAVSACAEVPLEARAALIAHLTRTLRK
jgi:hypothetical protein